MGVTDTKNVVTLASLAVGVELNMGPESVEESLAGGPPQGVDLVDPKQCQAESEGGPARMCCSYTN